MKIHSMLKILKKISFGGILLFFVNFLICTLFSVKYNYMVWATLPLAVLTFISYSTYCIFENIFINEVTENICENKNKIVSIRKYKNKSNQTDVTKYEHYEKTSAC